MSMSVKRDGHERTWFARRYPAGNDNRRANRIDRARRKRLAEREAREER